MQRLDNQRFNDKMVYRKRENIVFSYGPLQLGGLYTYEPDTAYKGFNGCIRNLRINGIVSFYKN